jgi:sugar phosphate isomerase/epimerase
MVSRREFLRFIGATAAGVTLASRMTFSARANPLGMPIGFQGYDARFLLIEDWDQGWLELRNMGYQSVDLVSFKGYGYEHSALADFSAKKIRDKLSSIGMICENCQYYFAELHGNFDEKMAFSHELGLKNIICAPEPTRMKTIDDWKWQADQLNELGGKVRQAGFQLGYHNHNQEFLAIDSVIPYDVLMDRTDPALVKFQIDVGNLTFAGGDAIAYLHKYHNRYFSMHAKDYLPGKTSVPVGQGTLDWIKIFKAVRQTPIKNYFAEVAAYGITTLQGVPASAWPTDSIDELRQSYMYLHHLHV